jgi:hypothetical protein
VHARHAHDIFSSVAADDDDDGDDDRLYAIPAASFPEFSMLSLTVIV